MKGCDSNGRGHKHRQRDTEGEGDVPSKPICESPAPAVLDPADRGRRKTAKMSRAHAERRPAAMVLTTGANTLGTNPCSFV